MVKADLDKETRLAMQRVAREEMKHRIYADILADMMVCDIEGWDKMEYINELKTMLNTLGNIHKQKKNNKQNDRGFTMV